MQRKCLQRNSPADIYLENFRGFEKCIWVEASKVISTEKKRFQISQ